MHEPIRPEDVLADGQQSTQIGGVAVRKGTVAAFVANAKLLDALDPDTEQYTEVVAQLRALAPKIKAVGLLDVFEPRSPTIAQLLSS